jgi:hypothetical protein
VPLLLCYQVWSSLPIAEVLAQAAANTVRPALNTRGAAYAAAVAAGLDPQLLYDYRCRVLNMVKAHYGERCSVTYVMIKTSQHCKRVYGKVRVWSRRAMVSISLLSLVGALRQARTCMVKAHYGEHLAVTLLHL